MKKSSRGFSKAYIARFLTVTGEMFGKDRIRNVIATQEGIRVVIGDQVSPETIKGNEWDEVFRYDPQKTP